MVDGRWSQFNASTNPQFGVQWRKKLHSVQTTQLWYSTAVGQLNSVKAQLWSRMAVRWPWGEAPFWLDSSALLCSACSFPLWSGKMSLVMSLVFRLWCFRSSQGNIVFSHQWKGKMCSVSHRGIDLHREKFLPLVPEWSVLMQMRTPNPWNMIGPKSTVLIGQNGSSLIGWWRCG